MELTGPNKKRTGAVVLPAPPAPLELMTSALTDTTLTLTWEASVGATSYDVYQDAVILINVVGLTTNVVGLTTNTRYTFTVRAKNGLATSADSWPVWPTTDDNTRNFPPEVDIATFPWGLFSTSVHSGDNLDAGSTWVEERQGNSQITLIAPNNVAKFHGTYAKHNIFNADDTIMKFQSSGGGQAFVPVATLGTPGTYDYIGVNNGGMWSNAVPDRVYCWAIPTDGHPLGSCIFMSQQIYVQSYGNETLLHDFSLTHTSISIGYNEGNISYDDKYVALTMNKVGGGQEIVILDLDDCNANPNQPSNIYSRMDIVSDTVLDWVSMSPSGTYVILAYFNEMTLNPLTGNAIIVYHNTSGTPTLNTGTSKVNSNGPLTGTVLGCAILQESHGDMALDINGEDCIVLYKHGGEFASGDDQEQVGGVMGYDGNTFLSMTRLRDGRVQYFFNAVGGNWGGYMSGRNNLRPGYIYLDEGCCGRDNAMSTDQVAVRLDYTSDNKMEYFGRSFARIQYYPGGNPDDTGWDAQGCPSRNGDRIHFDSWMDNDDLFYDHESGIKYIGQNQSTAFVMEAL